MYYKKAIGPVVASALLLVVAVAAIIGFQGWFSNYQSGLNVKVEGTDVGSGIIIEQIVGTELYVRSSINENISYSQVSVEGGTCLTGGFIVQGVNVIDINDCASNITLGENEIVLYTTKGIISKFQYISYLPESAYFTSCYNIYLNDNTSSNGDYNIDIDGLGGESSKTVYCDMSGGGYTWYYDTTSTINYTSLLIQSNTTHGSTSFSDSSPITPHTISRADNTIHSTTQSYFGDSSLYFDGTDDNLNIPDDNDFYFDGNFTIDMWLYQDNTDATFESIYSQFQADSGSQNSVQLNTVGVNSTNGALYIRLINSPGTTNTPTYSTAGITTNSWYHIAFVRENDNIYFFVNGVRVYNNTHTGTLHDSTRTIEIGTTPARTYDFDGYLDEYRVSKGIARWTTDFTPPTRPYRFQ